MFIYLRLFFLTIYLGLLLGSDAVAQEEDLLSPFKNSPRLQEIREKLKEWDQAVLGFRKEHQFVLTTGTASGQWHFKRFGNQRNKVYESSSVFSKFQYSFHIPIYQGFGYYLGSSTGYMYERDLSQEMEPASAVMFPGLLAGLALNITPGLRLTTGFDYYLERWSGLGERDGEDSEPTISVTARALDFLVTLDVFFRLKWAVRFEAHRHEAKFTPPKEATDKPVDAVIAKRDNWVGMGLLYHLF